MNILAWLVLGAIASDIAALIAIPDGGRQHGRRMVVLGTAAAVVFGYAAGLLGGMKDPIQGVLEPVALGVAVLAAVAAVTGQTLWGRGRRPPLT